MSRLFAALLLVLCIGVPCLPPVMAQEGAPIAVAQETKKPTLWDFLFGTGDKQDQDAAPVPAPAMASPSITALEPPKPKIEKSATATRLAVLGDSLADNLAGALERAHAEDPNIVIVGHSAGSSGFVRDDYFDWNARLSELIDKNDFDIAVVIIGINDRQPIGEDVPLSDPWKAEYSTRLERFLGQMRVAGKAVIWVGLPPMAKSSYSLAMTQISSLQRLAAFSAGAEFVDIYERFVDEEGNYSSYGPDLNGQDVQVRRSDGIHFTAAGADKLAYYVNQSLKRFYRGGAVSFEVADVLAGTDAEHMVRPPFQGLGQMRLLEVAGAVIPLTGVPPKSEGLIEARRPETGLGFDSDDMLLAPVGRADAFGAGIEAGAENELSAGE
jgi:uncharacterized protein